MGRLLDEDMVINIIKNGDYYMTWGDRAMLIEEIKDLPSAQPESEHTMEEFMYGQDLGSPEDGSL